MVCCGQGASPSVLLFSLCLVAPKLTLHDEVLCANNCTPSITQAPTHAYCEIGTSYYRFFCGAQDLKQNKATAKFEVKNSLLINKASNPATHLDRKIVSQICLLPLCLFLGSCTCLRRRVVTFFPRFGGVFWLWGSLRSGGFRGFRRSRCVLRSRVCLRLGLGSKHRPAQDKIEVGVS